MRVGFFLDNASIPDADLRRPEKGNPGIGGTEYRFAAIPWALTEFGDSRHEPVILAPHVDLLPSSVSSHQCKDVYSAPAICKKLGLDALVFRPWSCQESMRRLADAMDAEGVLGVAWAGNALDHATFDMFAEHPGLRVYVSVGREIVDYYRDLPIIYKSTYIFNGLRTDGIEPKEVYASDTKIVTYIGSLIPAKGFHRLARLWPEIQKVYPDAELHVIGSGKLYGRSAKMGELGVADAAYEAEFLPYLTDSEGQLDRRVRFHGILGVEKYDVMRRSSVGIANPTGATETFCAAAVEFQILGVPVVSAAEGGLLDTVLHRQTGFLCNTDEQIVESIVRLLGDPALQEQMGREGAAFAREKFTFERAVSSWYRLLDQLESGRGPVMLRPKMNLMHRRKWLKESVRIGKKVVPPWRTMRPIGSMRTTRVMRSMVKTLVMPKAWEEGRKRHI